MTCASCSGAIEKHFTTGGPQGGPIPGVESIVISLLTNRAVVRYNPSLIKQREIISEIEDLGFEACI
jgi:Cu+-exporting ATPase